MIYKKGWKRGWANFLVQSLTTKQTIEIGQVKIQKQSKEYHIEFIMEHFYTV